MNEGMNIVVKYLVTATSIRDKKVPKFSPLKPPFGYKKSQKGFKI